MDNFCFKCGSVLSSDEIGLHKKMVNRGAEEFMCMKCLSEYFGIPIPQLEKLIEYYREMGCTLFV